MPSLENAQTYSGPKLNNFKVAAIQMASGPNVEGNLHEARRLIADAAAQGAKLVVLPEFFAIMGMKNQDMVKVREQAGQGTIQSFMSEMARMHRIWLMGSIPLAASTPDKVRNSLLVFDEQGKQVARYDKIHLFSLTLGSEHYNEASTIEAGDKVVVVDSPFGRIGLAVCYDLRFPEIFRAMQDVNIIVLPSAFTATTGKVHWKPLVRARAIENLSYVIAAAQGGYHVSGRETHGHTMIVDPWGRIVDELQRGSGVVMADVDMKYQASLRNSLPALSHRILSCDNVDKA